MELMDVTSSRNIKCLIVALENKELRVYSGKNLVHSCQTNDIVAGIKYGTYGSEGNTLALSYRNGGIEFKMVSRKAKLEASGKGGPPPEQEIPLNLPTRTTLYMDQTEREKKYSTEMHRVFQKELCKMRLTTARAFVKILTDGQGPLSYTSGASVKLVVSVQGLGPLFKLKLQIQNTGVKPMAQIPVLFSYNQEIYTMKQSKLLIPVLLPNVQYEFFAEVSLVPQLATGEDTGERPVADILKVFVCSDSSSIPLITAVVQMPIPDLMLMPQVQ
jgi:Bardet-Biedl syndrome 1 protein